MADGHLTNAPNPATQYALTLYAIGSRTAISQKVKLEMKTIKSILPILIVLILFLGYSYYNYSKRAKAVDGVESYMNKNNFKRIWNFREAHFNVFDWIIEDKSQFNLIYVNADMLEKETNENYWVQFSSWKKPEDLESLTNYTVKRQGDKFQITINDLFWVPTDKDSLTTGEIKGTVFEIVDNWIKKGE
jgi:hypothetical protein